MCGSWYAWYGYLPPLNSDADYQEDAGRVSKVAAALSIWEDEVENLAVETKVQRESQKVGDEEENVSQTEERLEVVKHIGHGLVRQHQQADAVP